MDALIDRIADLILSVMSSRMQTALDKGNRRTAYFLAYTFLLIVLGMTVYAIYGLVKLLS